MLLKPLDVVVSVKAAVVPEPGWTMAEMSEHLGVSPAQVFRAARNAATAQLLIREQRKGRTVYLPHRPALLELLIHGIKYMVIAARGPLTRGVPTAYAAPVLSGRIAAGTDPVPVWPAADGAVRGESFEPLHACVPFAARADERLYAAMALVDSIRGGRARERALAAKLLPEVLVAGDE
jgi:hypothetical protein